MQAPLRRNLQAVVSTAIQSIAPTGRLQALTVMRHTLAMETFIRHTAIIPMVVMVTVLALTEIRHTLAMETVIPHTEIIPMAVMVIVLALTEIQPMVSTSTGTKNCLEKNAWKSGLQQLTQKLN